MCCVYDYSDNLNPSFDEMKTFFSIALFNFRRLSSEVVSALVFLSEDLWVALRELAWDWYLAPPAALVEKAIIHDADFITLYCVSTGQ